MKRSGIRRRAEKGEGQRRARAKLKRHKRLERKRGKRESFQAWRDLVLRRAGFRCERCSATGRRTRLECHHLIPRGRGGKDEPWNGAALCWDCHSLVHHHLVADWGRWLARTEAEARAIREALAA